MKGIIQIYTGDGKGKTSAGVGSALRFAGHNKKVCYIQFFKPENFYGEQKILKKIKNIDFFSFVKSHPYMNKKINFSELKKQCDKAIKFFENMLMNNIYDVFIIDELNIALRDGLVDIEKFIKLLKKRPEKTNIIITGRSAPEELIDISDIVTEMIEVKHDYRNVKKARKTIEF